MLQFVHYEWFYISQTTFIVDGHCSISHTKKLSVLFKTKYLHELVSWRSYLSVICQLTLLLRFPSKSVKPSRRKVKAENMKKLHLKVQPVNKGRRQMQASGVRYRTKTTKIQVVN